MSKLPAAVRTLRTARGLLWVAVLVVAGVTVGLIVRGEARERAADERVEEVSLYVRRVNGVERGLALELARVRETYQDFGRDAGNPAGTAERLDGAVATLAKFRRQVAALEPPPEAQRLHEEIVELIDLELALSREIRDMGRTLPLVVEGSQRAQRASRRLLRDLRAAESLAEQGGAFQRYSRTLADVARDFTQLNSPAVLKPSLQSEAKRLRRLSALAKQTANALGKEEVTDAQQLSNRLAKAAAAATVVTKAERQAVAAYRRRVRAVGRQERVVAEERERVAAALG